ncbi:MAG: hypothetical protein RR513_06460 [Muribaculaceae bacterium]
MNIPDLKLQKIKNQLHWNLSDREKEMLDASFFLKRSQAELYILFLDHKCTPKTATGRAGQIFNSDDAKEYIEDRIKWFKENWFGIANEKNGINNKSREDRKKEADEAFEDKLMEMVKYPTPENLDLVKLYASKMYSGNDYVPIKEELPRRYITEDCDNCRYKILCHDNTFDECPLCKYKKFALENGCEEYNYKNQLEIKK